MKDHPPPSSFPLCILPPRGLGLLHPSSACINHLMPEQGMLSITERPKAGAVGRKVQSQPLAQGSEPGKWPETAGQPLTGLGPVGAQPRAGGAAGGPCHTGKFCCRRMYQPLLSILLHPQGRGRFAACAGGPLALPVHRSICRSRVGDRSQGEEEETVELRWKKKHRLCLQRSFRRIFHGSS